MKILAIADKESKYYWDFYEQGKLDGIDLIISCGDLDPNYLSFLTTFTPAPVLYVHGNHDKHYDKTPPDGCISIEDDIYVHEGVRILGLGGCLQYNMGPYQYTQKEMIQRVRKCSWKIKKHKGFDILVTHAPALGLHDDEDLCHKGFDTFNKLVEKYHPKFFVHGHVHLNYGAKFQREDVVGETRVVNAFEKYVIEI